MRWTFGIGLILSALWSGRGLRGMGYPLCPIISYVPSDATRWHGFKVVEVL